MSSWATVATTWAALRAHHVYVAGVNAVAPIAPELRAGNRTRLALVATALDRLGINGDLTRSLEAGNISLEKWVAIANVQGGAINDVLKDCDEGNYLSRLWTEVVIETGKDTGEIIRQGAAGFGLGAGVVVAVLVALWLGGKLR